MSTHEYPHPSATNGYRSCIGHQDRLPYSKANYDCIVAIATAIVYVTSVLNLNGLGLVSLVQTVPYIIGVSMMYDNPISLGGK